MSTVKVVKDQTDLSGVLGQNVSVRKVSGRVEFRNRPKLTVTEPSDNQLKIQKTFKSATQYANQQIADDATKELYTKGITSKLASAYMVAMSDFLVPPTVDLIDTDDYQGAIGDILAITATDDFKVTRVKVVITDPSGTVIEQGDAALSNNNATVNRWEYPARVANPVLTGTKIKAIAYDRPGNKGTSEIVMI